MGSFGAFLRGSFARLNIISAEFAEDSDHLISKLKRASLCGRAVTADMKLALNKHSSEKDFVRLGPSSKMKTLRNADIPKSNLYMCFRKASQDMALTGIQKCINIFPAAIRCYYSFCELRGFPKIPARGMIIVGRSAISNPAATCPNYVGCIRKACSFLEEPLSWDTPAVANVIAALKLQDEGRYRAPNFIRIDIITKILSHESRDVDLGHPPLSFLYALRVTSGDHQLRREFPNGDMQSLSPLKGSALIGLRWEKPGQL